MPYVKSLSINGAQTELPIITHSQIADGGTIAFDMSEDSTVWASGTLVGLRAAREDTTWLSRILRPLIAAAREVCNLTWRRVSITWI